jgi:flagellar hook-length control protein FliK
MLTINPSSLRASLGDAAPGPAGGSQPAGGDPAGFASLLRQTQAAPAPAPAPAPLAAVSAEPPPAAPEAAPDAAPTSDHEATSEAEPASAESDAARRTRALFKGKPGTVDEAPAGSRQPQAVAEAADGTRPAPGSDHAAASRATPAKGKAADTAIDPSVLQWLAGLQRAAGAETAVAKSGGTGDSADTDVAATRGSRKGLPGADLRTGADPKDGPAPTGTPLTDAAATNPLAAALAAPSTAEKPASAPAGGVGGVKDAAAASTTGGFAPVPGASTGVAAPAAVAVAAPVTAPDFAHELGLRLSVLARDGVQHAELQLNPADMGPVSVQIVMDGTQAHVDFGADLAATRQAIETGLPELASALRDAGFTLAGGGVSQHGGGRGSGSDGQPGARSARLASDTEVKQVSASARRLVRRGGVDLFA